MDCTIFTTKASRLALPSAACPHSFNVESPFNANLPFGRSTRYSRPSLCLSQLTRKIRSGAMLESCDRAVKLGLSGLHYALVLIIAMGIGGFMPQVSNERR